LINKSAVDIFSLAEFVFAVRRIHNHLAYTSHIRDLESCNFCTVRELHQLRINCRGAVIPYKFFFHSAINSHYIMQSQHLLCWQRYSPSLRTNVTVTAKGRHCLHPLASSIYCTFSRPVPLRYIAFLTSSKELFTDGISRVFAAMGLLSETCGDFYFCCNSFTCAHLRTDCSCTCLVNLWDKQRVNS